MRAGSIGCRLLQHEKRERAMILLQVIVGGLLLGAIYALFSAGLTLIWGMMNFINFAHGEFVMLGMYVALLVVMWLGGGPAVFGLAAAFALFVLGVMVYFSLIRHVTRGPMLASWAGVRLAAVAVPGASGGMTAAGAVAVPAAAAGAGAAGTACPSAVPRTLSSPMQTTAPASSRRFDSAVQRRRWFAQWFKALSIGGLSTRSSNL